MNFFEKGEIEKLKAKVEAEFGGDNAKESILEICNILEDLGNAISEITEQLEEIDQDLGTLEDMVYSEFDDGEEKPEEINGFQLQCPACNKLVTIVLEDADNDKIICPNCKAELNFDSPCGGGCCGDGGHGGCCGGEHDEDDNLKGEPE